jgi:hypothetical protein
MALSLSNGGASRVLGLKILRVPGKGGRTDYRGGLCRPAWADRPRPISAWFGRPFAPVGPQVIMHFGPSTCMILTMSSSRPRWRFSSHEVQSFMLEGPIRRTREGGSEWEPIKILLERDGNSNKMNTASNTRLRLTTQVGQAHVATGVPLDLGTNTQPSDSRTQRKTKPRVYRPTPVRPVSTTCQTGPFW